MKTYMVIYLEHSQCTLYKCLLWLNRNLIREDYKTSWLDRDGHLGRYIRYPFQTDRRFGDQIRSNLEVSLSPPRSAPICHQIPKYCTYTLPQQPHTTPTSLSSHFFPNSSHSLQPQSLRSSRKSRSKFVDSVCSRV